AAGLGVLVADELAPATDLPRAAASLRADQLAAGFVGTLRAAPKFGVSALSCVLFLPQHMFVLLVFVVEHRGFCRRPLGDPFEQDGSGAKRRPQQTAFLPGFSQQARERYADP